MNILIVYASNSGSTHLTAQKIEDLLKDDFNIDLKKAVHTDPDEFYNYDLILMGSPSWSVEGKEGMPHEDVLHLMRQFEGHDFQGKWFSLFGCGDSSYTYFCGAVDHMESFVKEHNAKQITDPLKINGFFFDEQSAIKQIEEWVGKLERVIKPARSATDVAGG